MEDFARMRAGCPKTRIENQINLHGIHATVVKIYFSKDQLQKPCKDWLKAEGKASEDTMEKEKYHYEKRKVVKFFLRPDREKMNQRMCLSEHPFGTIKRAMGGSYFLLRGIKKVTGEFALLCPGYNLERAKNLLGFEKMMELMKQKKPFRRRNTSRRTSSWSCQWQITLTFSH